MVCGLKHLRGKGSPLLAFALAVLGLNAIIPTGYMIVPSATHVLAIVPCPSTNELARIVPATAEPHAAVDHMAMGHHEAGTTEAGESPPASAQPDLDCAFSALSLAAMLPDRVALHGSGFAVDPPDAALLPTLLVEPLRYLRPPLRAPPPTV